MSNWKKSVSHKIGASFVKSTRLNGDMYKLDLYSIFRALEKPVYIFCYPKEVLAKIKISSVSEKLRIDSTNSLPDHSKRSNLFIIFLELSEIDEKYVLVKRELLDFSIPIISVNKFLESPTNISLSLIKDELLSDYNKKVLRYKLQPYNAGLISNGRKFFGREDIIQFLINTRDSCYIVGPRRIGKSSLVQEYQERAGETSLILRFNADSKFNRVSYTTLVGMKPDSSLDQICKDIISGFKIKIENIPVGRELIRKNQTYLKHPKEALKHIINKSLDQLTIVLDEVDKFLVEDHFQNNWTFSYFLQELVDSKNMKLILVGYEDLEYYMSFNKFPLHGGRLKRKFLNALRRDEVESLIKEPTEELEFSFANMNDAVSRIWHFSSGRPNLVHCVCSSLIENKIFGKEKVFTKQDINDAIYNSPEYDIMLGAFKYMEDNLAKSIYGLCCFIRNDEIDFDMLEAGVNISVSDGLNLIRLSQIRRVLDRILFCEYKDYNIALSSLFIRGYLVKENNKNFFWRISNKRFRDSITEIITESGGIIKWLNLTLN